MPVLVRKVRKGKARKKLKIDKVLRITKKINK